MGKIFESLKDSLYDEISNVKSIEEMPKRFYRRFFETCYHG